MCAAVIRGGHAPAHSFTASPIRIPSRAGPRPAPLPPSGETETGEAQPRSAPAKGISRARAGGKPRSLRGERGGAASPPRSRRGTARGCATGAARGARSARAGPHGPSAPPGPRDPAGPCAPPPPRTPGPARPGPAGSPHHGGAGPVPSGTLPDPSSRLGANSRGPARSAAVTAATGGAGGRGGVPGAGAGGPGPPARPQRAPGPALSPVSPSVCGGSGPSVRRGFNRPRGLGRCPGRNGSSECSPECPGPSGRLHCWVQTDRKAVPGP